MKFGEKLRDWLERICIRHLTVMLIAGSATSYVYSVFDRRFVGMLALVPAAAWTGEYWRFVSFVFCPLEMHPIFAFFVYYFFFLMGTTLEADWGPARFTRYIATAVAVTVGLSFFYPIGVYTNEFIFTSIFLAFAVLYPDFLVYVFFILPVKMKYLAGFTWVCYGLTLVYGGWPAKIGVAAVTVNFLIFFGPELFGKARTGRRLIPRRACKVAAAAEPFHRCGICGLTELKDPAADFRVCSRCGKEFCMSHLKEHPHDVV